MRKMKIGLALGSGAARGLAHIGVIRALEENNIKVDVIAGTSIGAVVGGLYASGLSVDKINEFAKGFGGRRFSYWMDPSFFRRGGLLKGDKIEQALKDLLGPVSFADLAVPFYALATDLMTGRGVVISNGDVVSAIRASFAIPGIFSPVRWNGNWLVDGAIAEPIPTKILHEVKCDVIIAVNVSSMHEGEVPSSLRGEPRILDVIVQTLVVAQQKMAEPCMKLAHVGITPAVGEFDWVDFSKSDELIAVGYEAAMRSVPTIKKTISWRQKLFFLNRLFRT